MYKCGICGKEYNELTAYLRCVNSCGERVKAEAEKTRRETLEKTKNERIERLKASWNAYQKDVASFKKDYPREYEALRINNAPFLFDMLDTWLVL